MDALRAMREARYEEAAARARKGPSTPASRPTAPTTAPATAVAAATVAGKPGLCGHRSMNGRTCTRDHGHAAKSHRYG